MRQHEREAAAFLHTYKRLPLEIERGEGMELITADGTRYLDLFAGIAVNALGHAHPAVVGAIERQARRYIHVSNYFLQEPQIALAEMLIRNSGYRRVFFANSGTEAVEGAVKIARRWGSTRGKRDLVSFTNAFHGRTMGALSLMDRPNYLNGFGPFLDHCVVAAFNSVEALRAAVTPSTAAVVLEFIQGEGGIRPVSPSFVAALKELQASLGFLVVADEIQSGIGRTGRFLGFQHFDIRPNLVTLAKPIGGGLPLGAILTDEEVGSVIEPGMHGTTFGGNPVACAAGAAVIREVVEGGLMTNAAAMGRYLLDQLQQLQADFPRIVREVRGFGLMVGMELSLEGDPIVAELRSADRILLNCTDKTVLRFVPPLIIGKPEIDRACEALRRVFGSLP
jgi:predicted acetylornithine/succinylornithine family transaminase